MFLIFQRYSGIRVICWFKLDVVPNQTILDVKKLLSTNLYNTNTLYNKIAIYIGNTDITQNDNLTINECGYVNNQHIAFQCENI